MNKVVVFLKPWRVYNVGEIAGFPLAEANMLIRSGIAEPYTPPKNTKTSRRKKEEGDGS